LCGNSRLVEHEDFSVVVRNWASQPKPWQWESIAGRNSAIERSKALFSLQFRSPGGVAEGVELETNILSCAGSRANTVARLRRDGYSSLPAKI
jgi:hypothetical protein